MTLWSVVVTQRTTVRPLECTRGGATIQSASRYVVISWLPGAPLGWTVSLGCERRTAEAVRAADPVWPAALSAAMCASKSATDTIFTWNSISEW